MPIRSAEELVMAQRAAQLAAEVLAMIEPHVAPGVTNDALDRLCHDHLLNVQGARPANLGYLDYPSYPKTVRPTPPFEAVRSYLFTYIKLTASA